jgi:phage repressor protein C with HTH and peptisase S24 domain
MIRAVERWGATRKVVRRAYYYGGYAVGCYYDANGYFVCPVSGNKLLPVMENGETVFIDAE